MIKSKKSSIKKEKKKKRYERGVVNQSLLLTENFSMTARHFNNHLGMCSNGI
jgi:hypothetical protein